MKDNLDESYLMHYGVLGMKWGIRKARYDSGNRLYKSGHTITDNDRKIQSIRSKGRLAGRVASAATAIGLTAGVATGKINIPQPWLTIPVASVVVDANVRAWVNQFTTPYRIQNENMRIYRNNPENRR